MPNELHFEKIDTMAAVYAVSATLRRIDERLVDHGERVAYIACAINEGGGLGLEMKPLFLLSLFHDIGAYKTEEIDRMVEFETHDVWNHSIYGYLFLKYMTPLDNYAKAILHHHTAWTHLETAQAEHKEYAALIHLADRIDIAVNSEQAASRLKSLYQNRNGLFNPDYVLAARDCCTEEFIKSIINGSYRGNNMRRCEGFDLSAEEAFEYLKMLVYAIDFRSEHTVTHTINTVSLSLDIARYFKIDDEQQEKIYLGALLHDVGKIAIPVSILESPGKLSDEQMALMRTHVTQTQALISGIVPADICEIAIRHHEKLDGSGYPRGLTASMLDLPQRIVAVADIVSALSGRRSYKEAFPKEKTLNILREMSGAKLDGDICAYVIDNYDGIIARTEPARAAVIAQYQEMMAEFRELSEKINKL